MTDPDRPGAGYLTGLVTGAVIGSAAVFLLSTKKGRRLAKSFTKKGGRTLRELENLLKEIETQGVHSPPAPARIIRKKLSHIKNIQAKGRAAVSRYFKKAGKALT